MRATVYSIYMANISPRVVAAQRRVVERFLPMDWEFVQYQWTGEYSHPAAMTLCVAKNQWPLTVFLDIDCVPLSREALELVGARAEIGMLVGAVQRANHIKNDCHLYVGPFCMAFSNYWYARLGSPTFYETERGDVGEELTYRWREQSKPVYFLWPTEVRNPLWDLDHGRKFGLGTTYEGLFYHEFCARNTAGNFERRCDEILEAAGESRALGAASV